MELRVIYFTNTKGGTGEMIVKIPQLKKALEKMALEWKSCEGDLARQRIDLNVREITYKYCGNEEMITNMRKYYETLKWRRG